LDVQGALTPGLRQCLLYQRCFANPTTASDLHKEPTLARQNASQLRQFVLSAIKAPGAQLSHANKVIFFILASIKP
jgi:hypothetical protein